MMPYSKSALSTFQSAKSLRMVSAAKPVRREYLLALSAGLYILLCLSVTVDCVYLVNIATAYLQPYHVYSSSSIVLARNIDKSQSFTINLSNSQICAPPTLSSPFYP
ncbi:uncharacterized protein BDW43DRAFT_285852 [Aspergillus alliaceus]|uniref:uncharacterized protein n=1 Tax=Petromyces alliaceus TaxID=209559 RepID=UPI0012A572EB|nr:uncharacterized protein BDW43DRAFT_285852 [Aspergillus alliaceus]KAB8230381.1 hypothetical protein BDW43DRAFT_285852 [Aspergillus alliaceus]